MSVSCIRLLPKIVGTCYSNRFIYHSVKNVGTVRSTFQQLVPILRFKATLVQSTPTEGKLKRVLNKIGWLSISRSKLKRSGYYLYESFADHLNYMTFFREFNMEDSFFSWFLITELHVWMLSVRVMAEGEEGRFVRNSLIEAMWADTSTRAKKLDVLSSTDLKNQLLELSEQFQAAIVGYDEGLLSDDRVLAGAIWRRFFKQECGDPEQVERLVKYIREQVKILEELPQEKLLYSPKIKWISVQPIEDSIIQ